MLDGTLSHTYSCHLHKNVRNTSTDIAKWILRSILHSITNNNNNNNNNLFTDLVGPWSPLFFLRHRKKFLRSWVFSLTPKSQPGGPGYFFLSGSSPWRIGCPTSSISYRQRSSPDHMTTQALPLRQNRNIFRGILGHRPTRILKLCAFLCKFYISDPPGTTTTKPNTVKWTEACITHSCCCITGSSFQIWWRGPDIGLKGWTTTVE